MMARGFDVRCFAEQFLDESLNFFGSGGGEEGQLKICGTRLEKSLDRGAKAGVEHLIGFVKHQQAEVREVYKLELHELLESPGSRQQDFKRARYVATGHRHFDAAQSRADPNSGVVSEVLEYFRDLLTKIAGGNENNSPGTSGFGDGIAFVLELLHLMEGRQSISECFATPSFGDAND